MTRPEMIMFDYGYTLSFEPDFDPLKDCKLVYDYITENPENISFENFHDTIKTIISKAKKESGSLLEIPIYQILKVALEYMNLTLSVPLEEIEEKLWANLAENMIMPNIDLLLEYLHSAGIRTAVISNLCFSGKVLKKQIDKILPDNHFEFILSSNDYLFRKPDNTMFDIALRKAGLTADKVWYCGDTAKTDVYGANGVGIFPVLYNGKYIYDEKLSSKHPKDIAIPFEYLSINDWGDLIKILEQ